MNPKESNSGLRLVPARTYAESRIEQAEQCADANDFLGALKAYRDYLRVNRRKAEVWSNIGCCLMSLERLNSAKRCLMVACRLEKHSLYFSYLGFCYMQMNDIKRAIQCYRISVRIYEGNTDSLNMLFLLLIGAGREQEAVAAAGKLLEQMDPKSEKYSNFLADLTAYGLNPVISLVSKQAAP
ncbi:MAG: hypothetical protein HY918_01815 [Candidatus Doudnabacteria bacterium]|nr:hypothetical protein [Candidatus Doudnabacteria bacterium]